MLTALITGATSGIGKSTAKLLALKKYHLILCGRRRERLLEIQSELQEHTTVEIFNFDLTKKEDVENFFQVNSEKLKHINLLVNNAGAAFGLGPFQEISIEKMEGMIDLNLKGLMLISKHIVPHMITRREGTIINVSSIAGKEVYPNGNMYCATKHAVDALTKGMRLDLNPYGIRVCSINPGMVETEFSIVRFDGNENMAKEVYQGMTPLSPLDVAETIVFMATRPPHVALVDVTIFPTDQAGPQLVKRMPGIQS